MNQKIIKIIFLFFLMVGLISSIILSVIPTPEVCGENTGCSIVQTSPYENVIGIQNAYLGIIAFTILITIIFIQGRKPTKFKKNLIFLGLTLGSIIAIYFIYIQLFILKAICPYCMVTDLGIIFAFIIFLIYKNKNFI